MPRTLIFQVPGMAGALTTILSPITGSAIADPKRSPVGEVSTSATVLVSVTELAVIQAALSSTAKNLSSVGPTGENRMLNGIDAPPPSSALLLNVRSEFTVA